MHYTEYIKLVINTSQEVLNSAGEQGISPSTKSFSSKTFVWAPAHSFFLLKKYHSAVLVTGTREAVLLLSQA